MLQTLSIFMQRPLFYKLRTLPKKPLGFKLPWINAVCSSNSRNIPELSNYDSASVMPNLIFEKHCHKQLLISEP